MDHSDLTKNEKQHFEGCSQHSFEKKGRDFESLDDSNSIELSNHFAHEKNKWRQNLFQ